MDILPFSDWRFERDTGVAGFMRAQRVSTDALNVLHEWQAKDGRRSFEVLNGYEADDFMNTRLSTSEEDVSAGTELDVIAKIHGLTRRLL